MTRKRDKKTNPKMAQDREAKTKRRADLIESLKGVFSKLPKAYRRP